MRKLISALKASVVDEAAINFSFAATRLQGLIDKSSFFRQARIFSLES